MRHTASARRSRLLGPLGVTATALAGVVGGHRLAYLVAFGDQDARHALLADTGHPYLSTASLLAMALGTWVVGAVATRHLRGGERGTGTARVAARLALLQVTLFVLLEVGERVASGAPLEGLLHHGLLPIGLAVQLLAAVGFALILRAVAGAAEALGRALRGPAAEGGSGTRLNPVAPIVFRPSLLAGAWGLRGPPTL